MIKRVDGYSISNDNQKANILLTNEVHAVHNDIWVCIDGNRTRFSPDRQTKDALNGLLRLLLRYKQENRI